MKDSHEKRLWLESLKSIEKIAKDYRNKSDAQKLKENAEYEKQLQKYRSRKINNSICCMVDGCECPAIQSHTISKRYYLENIAEEGHLLHFAHHDDKLERKLILHSVGINDATVFKGYCAQHDNMIYAEIDNSPIKSIKGVFLQCLRVIDYSLYWENFGYQYMQGIKQKFRNTLGKEAFELYFNGKVDNTSGIRWIKSIVQAEIEENRLKGFGYHMHIYTYGGYEVHFERSNLKIPVAMYNYFRLSTGSMVYVIVLPAKDYTDLILVCNKELNLGLRWQNIIQNPLLLLNFVESCMMMGENWVTSPSIFEHMSEEKKRVIATDLMYYKCQTLCDEIDYDISIFDELRKDLINDLPDDNPQKAIEKQKICQLPVRNIELMKQQFYSKISELDQLTDWSI